MGTTRRPSTCLSFILKIKRISTKSNDVKKGEEVVEKINKRIHKEFFNLTDKFKFS